MIRLTGKKLFLLAAGLLLAASFAVFQFSSTEEKPEETALSAAAEKVRLTEMPQVMTLSGHVEGLTSSIISSRFSGQVSRVFVEDGQAVRPGDPLFAMDDTELSNSLRMAENSVRQAKARHDNDVDEYHRYASLYEGGAASRQQMESYRTKMLSSQADLDSARAALANAAKQHDDAIVRSPVNGVAANKNLTAGQNIGAGTQLMTVEELDQVHVVLHVEQRDLPFLALGSSVSISSDAYPDRTFEGTVHIINPAAGMESRMFRVKVKVDNPDMLLKPGMFVQAKVSLGAPRPVLTVPQKAVLSQKGMHYLFTEENHRAKKITVKTGSLQGDRIEIIDGVTEGMPVITNNLEQLREGDLLSLEELS